MLLNECLWAHLSMALLLLLTGPILIFYTSYSLRVQDFFWELLAVTTQRTLT